MKVSDRLLKFFLHEKVEEEKEVIEEETYNITLPFKGKDAVDIITALGVQVRSDDDTPDLKGRVFTVASTPKSGDAITLRQRLDAELRKRRLDPKIATFKVTAL